MLPECIPQLRRNCKSDHKIGLAEFCLRAFRRAKGKSIGPYAQAVATTVLLLKAD
jgi:hypothetical protein